jgi:hypothetical protein
MSPRVPILVDLGENRDARLSSSQLTCDGGDQRFMNRARDVAEGRECDKAVCTETFTAGAL